MKLVANFVTILTFFGFVMPSTLYAQSKAAPEVPAATTSVNSIVVFSDFQCPFSADLFFMLDRYQKAHPGQVRVLYKQSPLSIHPDAPLAHRAALAAGRQGRYNAMAELLYANQQHQDLPTLLAEARQLHLDMPRFRRDLDSPSIEAALDTDLSESAALGIAATPTLYFHGKSTVGALDDAKLDEILKVAPAQPEQSSNTVVASATIDPSIAAEIQRGPSAEQGTVGAPLTIVEFTDFQCPFCRAAAQPLEQFVAAHSREVHLVIHSFPLDFHPDSELANEAALAAGDQGKFWQMHDLLFAHQDALKLPSLRAYAEELHLDMKTFNTALESHRLAGQIAADRALGMKAGVEGTPTFFVDGRPMIGARSVPEWEQLLAQHTGTGATPGQLQQMSAIALPAPASQRLVEGSADAPLALTWYTDVRSAQAPAQGELIRSLASRYDGKLRVVFKAYPVAAHPDARIASAALVAASQQNKFWPMFDAITAHKDPLDLAALLAVAVRLRLDTAVFAAAMEVTPRDVQTDLDEGQRRGIMGAPVIFLNDRRIDGIQRESFYTAIADDELKQLPPAQAKLDTSPSAKAVTDSAP